MAIQIGKFLYGKVGSLVYKVVNGVQVVSQAPVHKPRKLSKAAFFTGNTFSAGTSIGAAIRKTLSPQIQGFSDTEMNGRLVSGLVKVLRACRDKKTLEFKITNEKLTELDFFEFNTSSRMRYMISLDHDYDERTLQFKVQIPVLCSIEDMDFPEESVRCTVKASVSCFRIWEGLRTELPETQSIVIDRKWDEFPGHVFSFNLPQDCLCMLTVFLEYAEYSGKEYTIINRRKMNPGSILKLVMTPGTYQHTDNLHWVKMKKIEKIPKPKAAKAPKYLPVERADNYTQSSN